MKNSRRRMLRLKFNSRLDRAPGFNLPVVKPREKIVSDCENRRESRFENVPLLLFPKRRLIKMKLNVAAPGHREELPIEIMDIEEERVFSVPFVWLARLISGSFVYLDEIERRERSIVGNNSRRFAARMVILILALPGATGY